MNGYLEVLGKYAVFNGRATRAEYWSFSLVNLIFAVAVALIDLLVFGIENGSGLLSGIYSLAILVPSIAVTARRLHDTNRSGWWMLLALVPFAGLVLCVFLAQESKPASGQYAGTQTAAPAKAA